MKWELNNHIRFSLEIDSWGIGVNYIVSWQTAFINLGPIVLTIDWSSPGEKYRQIGNHGLPE